MKHTKAAALLSLALAGTIVLGGCAAKPDDTLIDIDNGKAEITYGYGSFVAKYNQASYDMYYLQYMGSSYWDQEQDGKTMEDTVKQNVIDGMEEQYLDKLHADEYDVTISDDDKKNIEAAAKKFMSSNTQKALDQMGATQDYVEDLLEYETYQARVRSAYEDQAEVTVTDDEANQSSISYVLFSTASTTDSSGKTEELTDDEKKDLKKKAEDVAAASDFDEAVKDADETVRTHSYTTAAESSEDNVIPEEVIDAAKKLKEGEISDVIEVKDKGYYVVRMDKLLDEDATKTNRQTLTNQKKEEAYDAQIKSWKKKVTFSLNDKLWKQVKFDELFSQKTSDASGDASSD